ncbi:hypothetical protein F442_19964 [Phytophthora nicotianae P10297]|uniref:No apical meristem-associated C-terminal domain-containing protein n=1 Tax=Phytophthora nicotianae P10297 TaxID=1317064 RepID=W2Y8W1_PHYNI|nr:hypothetical protein F442_19964 [Phytophthora nicotianae P10297]
MPNATQWTKEDGECLCQAYTNISEDGAISTDQTSDLFWNSMYTAYQLLSGNGATVRKADAFQTHWAGLIRPDVALFASALTSVQAEHRSGWSEEDNMAEAENCLTAKREQLNANTLKSFEDGKNRSERKLRIRPEAFRLMHCYKILKQSARSMRDVPTPRKRSRLSVNSMET